MPIRKISSSFTAKYIEEVGVIHSRSVFHGAGDFVEFAAAPVSEVGNYFQTVEI